MQTKHNRLGNFFRLIIRASVFIFAIACTQTSQAPRIPDEATYAEDTDLMYKMCGKFTEESDIKRLRKVVISTQTLRFMQCIDFNGECTLYANFLKMVVDLTQNETLAPGDRIRLRNQLALLKKAIEEGKFKLHQAHAKASPPGK